MREQQLAVSRRGFVASLARPGGNVTGITQEGGQESTKRLELLTSAFPTISRVGVLWTQSVVLGFQQAQAAAQAIGRQVVSLEVKDPNDLGSVLSTAIAEHADALSVQGSALFEGPPAEQIVAFANRQRLPAIYGTTVFVRMGGAPRLRAELPLPVSARCDLRRQDPQGSEARRPSRRGADALRLRGEPQVGPGARADDPAVGAGPGDGADSVGRRRAG